MQTDWPRRIIHVDMDAFYAAVEQRDNPELRGKPVIIGGPPNRRGVVSTCSYEARKFGVRSAMPLREAGRRCPKGVFLPGDHRKYREVSRQIQSIFREYTPLVEPISVDEAFLDVTGCEGLFGPVVEIGRTIVARILEEIRLNASVGIGPNKFLAKVASDLQKPNGFVIIGPEDIERVLWPLPVRRIWGVGEKTAESLQQLGWTTIGEVARQPLEQLVKRFGAMGAQLYSLARGLDDRPVQPAHGAKSLGHEHTFSSDTADREKLESALLALAQEVGRRLRKHGLGGRTVTLKLRYSDFTTLTRAETLEQPTAWDGEIYQTVRRLWRNNWNGAPVRLIGVTLSKLGTADGGGRQMSLFAENRERDDRLAGAIDRIKDKYGEKAVTRARLLD